MRLLLLLIPILISSCAPVKNSDDYQTKYPDTPTMQSAEDATTGKLFKE